VDNCARSLKLPQKAANETRATSVVLEANRAMKRERGPVAGGGIAPSVNVLRRSSAPISDLLDSGPVRGRQ
jgi:hypothetical protein